MKQCDHGLMVAFLVLVLALCCCSCHDVFVTATHIAPTVTHAHKAELFSRGSGCSESDSDGWGVLTPVFTYETNECYLLRDDQYAQLQCNISGFSSSNWTFTYWRVGGAGGCNTSFPNEVYFGSDSSACVPFGTNSEIRIDCGLLTRSNDYRLLVGGYSVLLAIFLVLTTICFCRHGTLKHLTQGGGDDGNDAMYDGDGTDSTEKDNDTLKTPLRQALERQDSETEALAEEKKQHAAVKGDDDTMAAKGGGDVAMEELSATDKEE